jgi:hypothetical protein
MRLKLTKWPVITAIALLLAMGLGSFYLLKIMRRPRVFVGAYYYPWYYAARWSQFATTGVPQLGRYATEDRNTVKQHIQWARQADLDFFMICWVTPNFEDHNLKQSILPELEAARFPFVLMYDTAIALGIEAGKPLDMEQQLPEGIKVGEKLVQHFEYLADTYFKHKLYLKINGKPIVNIYLVRDMTNANPYLNRIRERLKQKGVELYLIADVVYWTPPDALEWPFLRANFQAITAYNMYYNHRPNLMPGIREQYTAMDRAARDNGMRFIPNVMPGYDDTSARGNDREILPRRDGQFYREYWDLAAPSVRPDQPFLLVTTFNEWHEGTGLEPSQEYGDKYLQLTRELIRPLREKVAAMKR